MNIQEEWHNLITLNGGIDKKKKHLADLLEKVARDQRKLCAEEIKQGKSFAQNKGTVLNAPLVEIKL